jgi:F0F1-type ATP synthase epsilon subunit
MSRKLKNVAVELSTPRGSVFSGLVEDVTLRTSDGLIAINPVEEAYLSLTNISQITLRVGSDFTSFALENAAASLRAGQLTVLAEQIRRVEPETS